MKGSVNVADEGKGCEKKLSPKGDRGVGRWRLNEPRRLPLGLLGRGSSSSRSGGGQTPNVSYSCNDNVNDVDGNRRSLSPSVSEDLSKLHMHC